MFVPKGASPLADEILRSTSTILVEAIVMNVYTEDTFYTEVNNETKEKKIYIDKRAGTMDVVINYNWEYPKNILINWGSSFSETSGIRAMPEKQSWRLVGLAGPDDYRDLGAITPNYKKIVGKSSKEPGDNLGVKYLKEGEVHIFSKDGDTVPVEGELTDDTVKGSHGTGAEIYLNAAGEIHINNGTNKFIEINEKGNLKQELINIITSVSGGESNFGDVIRVLPGTATENKYLESGVIFTGTGTPIKELRIKIGKKKVDPSEPLEGPQNTAVITIGDEVLNDLGVPELTVDTPPKKVVCSIDFNNGSKITIDVDGKINMNEGRTVVGPAPIMLGSAQKAVRTGDEINIPMSTPQVNPVNPEVVQAASLNVFTMMNVVTQILTPMGPCVAFLPTVGVSSNLQGIATGGSDSVIIGD